MFTAEVTKGFSYDEVTASPVFMIRMGLASPQGERVNKKYRKGQRVEFPNQSDYRDFLRLAREYGGDARCVGLPPR